MLPAARAIRAYSTEHLDTRWTPVDLVCMVGGEEVVARCKLVRGGKWSAMCISEAFSHGMLRAAGFDMADPYAVEIRTDFAKDLTAQFKFDPGIKPGWHWGTRLLQNKVQELEPSQEVAAMLKEQRLLFRLFLMDVVLANPDRTTHGNILWRVVDHGKIVPIPIDQSDCFHHLSAVFDPGRTTEVLGRTIAQEIPGMTGPLLDRGGRLVDEEFGLVTSLSKYVHDCASLPREQWYNDAGVGPRDVVAFIECRIDNLRRLARYEHWEAIRTATEGGYELKL